MWKDKEKLLEKIKEVGMSKMGLILLAGVLVFILSNLVGSVSDQKKDTDENSMDASAEFLTSEDTGSAATMEAAGDETLQYIARQEERLKSILEQMTGVGQVDVMISVTGSREKVVLSDNPYSQTVVEETDSAGGTRSTSEVTREDATVYSSDGSSQTPYVVKELEPELSGILVLAEGAGSDSVKAEIVEAVEALFGLPAHRIKVIKRRG